MTGKTEILRFPVLMVTEIAIRFGAVMAVLVGICRLNTGRLIGQFRGIMALQTFHHGNRLALLLIAMAIRASNTITGMERIQHASFFVTRVGGIDGASENGSQQEGTGDC